MTEKQLAQVMEDIGKRDREIKELKMSLELAGSYLVDLEWCPYKDCGHADTGSCEICIAKYLKEQGKK